MSVTVEGDASCELAEALNEFDATFIKSNSSRDSIDTYVIDDGSSKEKDETIEPAALKPNPMAFTIDFGETKAVDKSRLELLAKKSQARHQRVQSMSGSITKPSPTVQKPPMSCKLPRKSQGYNSEGYFSSDQEDSILSGSFKLRQSPLAQTYDKTPTNKFKSVSPMKPVSKSPIVDSIMSRSDTLPSRKSLNLPLSNTNSSLMRDVHKTPSFSNISSYQTRPMPNIIDISPDGILIADISSPELDILTPERTSTPEPILSPSYQRRAISEQPDLLKKPLYIDDDIDRESNNSSTGTYVIERDNYTEEQKARMSIDRSLAHELEDVKTRRLESCERDPEIIYDYPKASALDSKRDLKLKSPLLQRKAIPDNKDKNILEISYNHDKPESELAAQTNKQIKSTRSYLEKIKNRVKSLTKIPAKNVNDADMGSFTSVTTSGVFSAKKVLTPTNHRRCSLSKSEIDTTDYIHRREASVPVCLPSNFESTVLKTATKSLRDDNSDGMVGQLSNLSLNRCKGDKTWIQCWADSVEKYNNDSLAASDTDVNSTFSLDDKPPLSPRRDCGMFANSRNTPTKIPSPVGTLQRRTPDLIPQQETDTYLQKTQTAISNLQSKLHHSRSNIPPLMTSSLLSERALQSRLPVSQLSRSNSLTYRIRRRDSPEVPLKSPRTNAIAESREHKTQSMEGDRNSNLSPDSDRLSSEKTLSNHNVSAILSPHRKHSRNHSFDSRNVPRLSNDLHNANSAVNLRSVLQSNALDFVKNDQTRRFYGDKGSAFSGADRYVPNTLTMKRSSSYNTVTKNNNYLDQFNDYASDDSDTYDKSRSYKPNDSPLKSIVPTNSPKCPATPEMKRKFGTGLVRSSVRVTSKERQLGSRMSEPPVSVEERAQSGGHQSRKGNEPTRKFLPNRTITSRSSTRELMPKKQEKGSKKPAQHRSSSALASKEAEYTNWKKRASYDPMKAAQEGRKRQAKRPPTNKDDLSSPSQSSPVHRSASYHQMGVAGGAGDTSESDHETDVMVTSTHSDLHYLRYQNPRQSSIEARADDVTPTRDNIDFLTFHHRDRRKTFVLDSDTNSTTNDSSPVPERAESESDSIQDHVVYRQTRRGDHRQRHSGDYSMSSSTTSLPQRRVQPRYLDISKYRPDVTGNYLKRDTSKVYTAVLGHRPAPRHNEIDQKKQELEKWKRRSSYDPRKSAAQAKTKQPAKPVSNVLRSQSFHGPMLATTSLRYLPQPRLLDETYDQSSDNDF